MGTRYSAYVLRHWHLSDGQERIEVQQIATGESQRYHSLAAAYDWITAQARTRVPATPTSQDKTEAEQGSRPTEV